MSVAYILSASTERDSARHFVVAGEYQGMTPELTKLRSNAICR